MSFPPRVLLVLFLATAILPVTGCNDDYGSRRVNVTLRAPSQHPAYLIPNSDWETIVGSGNVMQPYKPANLNELRSEIEHWRVKEGPTPVSTTTRPYPVLYMLDTDDGFIWQTVNPKGKESSFSIGEHRK